MAKLKAIISDPEEGTSQVVELEESQTKPLIGRKIGDIIDGSIVNLAGNKLQITGGSDKDGFPMRPSVHGGVRRKVVLSGGVGFNPKNKGMRKRKTIRGNLVTDEIVQLNLKIVEKSKKAKEEKKKEGKELPEKKPQEEKPSQAGTSS
ncbi:MAG: 30S ribosomal protein S6e [Candidatus Bathyarchaeia archaeon]